MQNVADIYPLTPTQAGMLYHLLREDDPELYLEQFRADVTASADDDAWAAAWQTLVDRHPALRTIIVWKGLEEPRQVVREHVEIPVEVIDLRDLDAAEQAQVHDDVAASQRRDGLSLTTAPMSRVVVSRIADDRWHLIWTFHHIVVDGWSVGVLLDELTFLLTGEVIVDPATPFRDHVAHLLAQPPDLRRWDDVLGEVAEVAPVDLPGGTGVGRFERRRDRHF